ncbi:7571_t:CDS:2 [Ambispora gerdemannii]|uniref:7571_t:CDS:1 n=1 Tax=Ambispora gerdemannii TaxID=144530 RepID=A0A9N9CDY4_9GLOM|nr:7571_t:CDS:2 [Ambispora gerdemannii]
MSIPVNQTIKEYNDEIKKINAKYEELEKLLGRDSVYRKRKEELEKDLEKVESFNGKEGYEKEKEGVREFKKNLIRRLGFWSYGRKVAKIIKNKMTQLDLKVEDLATETQQKLKDLKNQEDISKSSLTDYHAAMEKIIATEEKINEEINKKEAQKKYQQLQEKFKNMKNSAEKEKINQEVEEFVTSDNIYYREYKSQANELLSSLKSGSFTYNKSPDADDFP